MLWIISYTAKPNIDDVRRSASKAHKQDLDDNCGKVIWC